MYRAVHRIGALLTSEHECGPTCWRRSCRYRFRMLLEQPKTQVRGYDEREHFARSDRPRKGRPIAWVSARPSNRSLDVHGKEQALAPPSTDNRE